MNKYRVMRIISQVILVLIAFMLLFWLLIRFNIISLESSSLPLAIKLNHETLGLKIGDSYNLSYTVFPKNIKYGIIKWTSSDSKIVSVNETTGYIEAKGIGTAIIKASLSLNNVVAECEINVTNKDILAKKVMIDEREINLLKGDSYEINYSLSPFDANIYKFDFISSDTSVVMVNENGIVKSVGVGTAVVTIKSRINNISDELLVNVYDYSAYTSNSFFGNILNSKSKSLSLSETNVELGIGEIKKLSYKIMPSVALNKVNWYSDNEKVVKIMENGSFIAVAAGEANIIAETIDGIVEVCHVKVTEKAYNENLQISYENLTMKVGSVNNIDFTYQLSNLHASSLVWNSSNTDVTKVINGKVWALNAGESIITVKSSDNRFKAQTTINVINDDVIPVQNINFSNKEIKSQVGNTINLIPNILPLDANGYVLKWTSSNEKVATVEDGFVRCLKEGEVIITLHNGTNVASVKIKIDKVLTKVVEILNGDNFSIKVNDTKYLQKRIIPAKITNEKIIWRSSNPNIVSVNGDGLIKGIRKGTAVVTVESDNVKDVITIKVI